MPFIWSSAGSRVPLMFNADCVIAVARPDADPHARFYKNADADEVVFIHDGTGDLAHDVWRPRLQPWGLPG